MPSEDRDPRAAIRERLVAGEEARALALAARALAHAESAEDQVALNVLAAQAARALADGPLEVRHLEAAEEAAARGAPGSLGAARLQLGLAHLRRGALDEAARTLRDALPLLDGEAKARAQEALVDAKTRAAETPPPPRRRIAPAAGLRTARARAYGMLEALYETDPEAPAREVLVRFLDAIVEATGADRGFVLLSQPDGLEVSVARQRRGDDVLHPHHEVSYSIARAAATEGRTVVAVKPAEDPRFAKSRSARRLGLKAVCAVPIRFRRECLGVAVLDRKTSEGGFDGGAQTIAGEFAKGAAGVIYRARRDEVSRAIELARLEEYARSAEKVRGRFKAPRIKGASPEILRVLELLERVAPAETRVLIRGESGTGKELVARTIHDNSPRRKGPFVAVNCAALPDGVVEAELFGHVAGAFTGAGAVPGLIRSAQRGTLFLDEVGTASPKLQATLLRFLAESEVRPVGGDAPVAVSVRVLSATNEDLEGLVASGRFRLDLLHRLNSFSIDLPPLRERPGDIAILAREFALEAAQDDAKKVSHVLTSRVLSTLGARPWPGNIRELRNAITELVQVGSLPGSHPLVRAKRALKKQAWLDAPESVPTLREAEKRTIQAALSASRGNKLKAARLLGISRRGLYYLMEDHGLMFAGERR